MKEYIPYENKNGKLLYEALDAVRKGSTYGEFVREYELKNGFGVLDKQDAEVVSNIYFTAYDSVYNSICELQEGLEERVKEVNSYISYIHKTAGVLLKPEWIDQILEEKSLKLIKSTDGA